MKKASHEKRSLVCLLRDPEDSARYRVELSAAGFQAYCVNALSFAPVNREILLDRLARPDAYAGLVVTSPRAVDALASAFAGAPAGRWQEKPAYSVGPRTAELLEGLGFQPVGSDSGTGGVLAKKILERHTGGTLLFLCGDRRRDELPECLLKAGIRCDELTVYSTTPVETLSLPTLSPGDWIVVFSPSAVPVLTNTLKTRAASVRLAAIGTTSAEALREAGWQVAAIAGAPTPVHLAQALRSAQHRGT